jgi:TPR repeat protein
VGYAYDRGEGTRKNAKKAFEWYLKAAEQGHAYVQTNVGVAYDRGESVRKNAKKAFEWYLKAAEQGNEFGQYNVGYAYEYGEGVGKNKTRAYAWHTVALNNGLERSSVTLALLSIHMRQQQIDRAIALSKKLQENINRIKN